MTTYAADHTALLIVDPYNDFMSAGGKLCEVTGETAGAVARGAWFGPVGWSWPRAARVQRR